MAIKYSPEEILRIAINVEKRGKKLYETLAQQTTDEKLQKMWNYLKDQEEDHRRVFQRMLDSIDEYILAEQGSEEEEAYFRAIAAGFVFTPDIIEQKTKELFNNDLDAIDFGISIEKESILVYSALGEMVYQEKQSVLEKVIREEKRHLIQLTVLRRYVEKHQ